MKKKNKLLKMIKVMVQEMNRQNLNQIKTSKVVRRIKIRKRKIKSKKTKPKNQIQIRILMKN